MNDTAIRIEQLSKRYRIGRRQAKRDLRETLSRAVTWPVRALRRRGAASHRDEHIWALRDISFEVPDGQVIGIIGDNGAGKSTLLKILSRITEPTAGRATIRGRVGSLLEVGTGFHPELSGRENVFLNGAVLGMRKAEIRAKFDEIVAFSGVERFLDTPVKRYSTGMAVRLAFAVAAHLEPEILIIDEVLAVGDAAFQKKCLGKMSDVASEGRTVLFVSHKLSAVQSLCDRAIWLQAGEIREDGSSGEVVAHYLANLETLASEHLWPDPATAPGNDAVRLRLAEARPADPDLATAGRPAVLTTRTAVDLVFEFWNQRPGARLNLGVILRGKEGSTAFYSAPIFEPEWHGKAFPEGLFRSVCHIPGDLLNDGRYTVQLYVVEDQHRILYRHDDILVFDITDDGTARTTWHGDWVGALRPILDWRTELIDP